MFYGTGQNTYYGKYRALVVNNNDPLRLGRLTLCVPSILGPNTETSWALPCVPYGGNENYGMSFIPEVGSTVWCEFEGGNIQYPIWVGVYFIKNEGKSDIPEESKTRYTKHHVLKTWAGHTIEFNDNIEEECIKIIDRAGQEIKMSCALQPTAGRRLQKETETEDKFQIGDTKNGSSIEITDLSGQKIELKSHADGNEILLKSQKEDGTDIQFIKIDNVNKKVILNTENANGDLEIVCNNSRVTLTGNDNTVINGHSVKNITGNLTAQIDGNVSETHNSQTQIQCVGKYSVISNDFIEQKVNDSNRLRIAAGQVNLDGTLLSMNTTMLRVDSHESSDWDTPVSARKLYNILPAHYHVCAAPGSPSGPMLPIIVLPTEIGFSNIAMR